MTLIDIISKVTRYAKNIIVTDNSASDAIFVTQTGTGSAIYANGKIRASDSIFSEQSFLSQTGIFTNYEGNDYLKLESSDDSARFFLNGSEKLTLKVNGNLGVGTTDPQAVLHVDGSIRIDASTSSAATAGANGDVPAQVSGYLPISLNGIVVKIPFYNV
jgi:hypothetical protein